MASPNLAAAVVGDDEHEHLHGHLAAPPPSPPSLQRLICQHTPHLAPMFGARSQRVASSPLAPLYADESAAETNFASLNMKKKRKKSM